MFFHHLYEVSVFLQSRFGLPLKWADVIVVSALTSLQPISRCSLSPSAVKIIFEIPTLSPSYLVLPVPGKHRHNVV